MTIEYLGSKAQIIGRLWSTMKAHVGGEPTSFADLFCGTASVSAFMRDRGFEVTANDTLLLCATFAEAALLTEVPPAFTGLVEAGIISRSTRNRYRRVLEMLNRLAPQEGFMFRTYSPAAEAHGEERRMYFTEENAGRLDAARSQIRYWEPYLAKPEHALLLTDLVRAANKVSNIAGTYGCYLKHWKARSLALVQLVGSDLTTYGPPGTVHRMNADVAAEVIEADVVYADPPYTKRQYAAYYHVLETLVAGDEPIVTGSTGLRPWEHAASDYCYRRKAPAALRGLVKSIRGTPDFFLSYNEDGQISHDEIVDILGERGDVSVHEFALRRYKSSNLNHKGSHVTERLYHVKLAS